MKSSSFALTVLVLAVACSRDAPTGSEQLGPNAVAAGSSGCYTVTGEINQVGVFPTFAGTISGDIEGSVLTQLDPASVRATGVVRSNSGEQTWQVTGGSIPELIGRTVRLALETKVVFAHPPIGRNNTTARVISGAEAGNLTYHGTLDNSPPPPSEARVEYHGVICP